MIVFSSQAKNLRLFRKLHFLIICVDFRLSDECWNGVEDFAERLFDSCQQVALEAATEHAKTLAFL